MNLMGWLINAISSRNNILLSESAKRVLRIWLWIVLFAILLTIIVLCCTLSGIVSFISSLQLQTNSASPNVPSSNATTALAQTPPSVSTFRSPTATQRPIASGSEIALPTPIENFYEPRGKIVFASGKDFDRELYILDLSTRDITQLTFNNQWDEAPSFSPDNSKVVFSSLRENGWQLYVIDIRTGAEEQITNFSGQARFPSWSPSTMNNFIVFEGRIGSSGNFSINIWSVNAEGDNLQQLTFSGADSRPSISPDGKKVVFGRALSDTDNNGRVSTNDFLDVFVYDLESSSESALTNTSGIDEFQCSYSPDGHTLIVSTVNADKNRDGFINLDDARDLYFLDADSGNSTKMDLGGIAVFSPYWSPDGGYILFVKGTSKIQIYNLGTQSVIDLVNMSNLYHPEWSK